MKKDSRLALIIVLCLLAAFFLLLFSGFHWSFD